jgi:hypothetical protein
MSQRCVLLPKFTKPIRFGIVTSLARKSEIASSKSILGLGTYLVETHTPFVGSMTSVKRQSVETRENSIGSTGPPSCQTPSRGSSRGSQISDPHPRIAIFKGVALGYLIGDSSLPSRVLLFVD